MILKEGIYHLTTPDLVSWWPFLLLAVCFYGLLPRIFLLIAGMVAQKKAIFGVDLNHVPCNRLWRRMITPRVETGGEEPAGRRMIRSGGPDETRSSLLKKGKPLKPGQEALILIPDDMVNSFSVENLQIFIKNEPGLIPKYQSPVSLDFEQDKIRLNRIITTDAVRNTLPVVLLQEAWQPPILENVYYLRRLREWIGEKTPIHIFLVGKPAPDNVFSNVDPNDWRIWREAVLRMEDPFFELNGLKTSS
jgi:hypothetical protein